MLTYHQTTTYDLPKPDLIQQWKHKLSDHEVQLIESRISHILLANNYQLSGLPLIEVTSAMKQKLWLQDWSKRIKFRIKRFGLPLLLADNISRRLKMNSWQKSVKLKMNSIEESYLK